MSFAAFFGARRRRGGAVFVDAGAHFTFSRGGQPSTSGVSSSKSRSMTTGSSHHGFAFVIWETGALHKAALRACCARFGTDA